MHKWLSILLCSIFVVCVRDLPAAGQAQIPMIRYAKADGLPSNKVYDIYKDRKGFFWVCTDKGVARFNGIKFDIFTTQNGLSDNEVFFCKEDQYGRIWMATYNGALCFYKDGVFHNSSNTPYLKLPFKSSFIKHITLEADSTLTIGFSESPVFINIDKDKVKIYDLNNAANAALIKKEGYRGIYDPACPLKLILWEHKINEGAYKLIAYSTLMTVNKDGIITRLERLKGDEQRRYIFSQDQSYMFSNKGIYSTDGKSLKFFDSTFSVGLNIAPKVITRVYFDGRNYFLCTLNAGLFVVGSGLLFPKRNMSSIAQDNVGNYWIGTLDSGIYYMSKFFNSEGIAHGAYTGKIYYSSIRQGKAVYVTEDNVVYCLDKGKSTRLYDLSKITQSARNAIQPGYAIDGRNKLFAFTGKHIVVDNIFNAKSKKEYSIPNLVDNIKAVIPIGDKTYIQGRLSVHEVSYGRDKAGGADDKIVSDSFNARIYCTAIASDTVIWYSSTNGTYKIQNGVSTKCVKFKDVSLKNFGFHCGYLIGYTIDNRLLICSKEGAGEIELAGADEKCLWDKFYAIDSRHVLISTNNLYRIISFADALQKDGRYKITTIEDPIVPLNAESICCDSNFAYFFSGGDIVSIKVPILLKESIAPQLFFNTLATRRGQYQIGNEMHLTFQESRNISISFSPVSFSGSGINCLYSVSKNDAEKWVPINSQEITMVNPEYGHYTVKIKAKTSSSSYSQPISFTVNIEQPLWTRWFFIMGYVVAGLATVVAFMRWRFITTLRRREKEHSIKVKFLKSEYKMLNALMNPHFIFNTLNNLQTLFNGDDKRKANKYLRVFADLIRQNMHNVSKELIPLQKELDLVTNYLMLEKLRFEEKLSYSIEINGSIDLSSIMVPPLLLQPLVENSIKHGILPLKSNNGTICLAVEQHAASIVIEVRDNGVGLKEAGNDSPDGHQSYGLGNIKRRIEQLNAIQDIKIDFYFKEDTDIADNCIWTVVGIVIPIIEN